MGFLVALGLAIILIRYGVLFNKTGSLSPFQVAFVKCCITSLIASAGLYEMLSGMDLMSKSLVLFLLNPAGRGHWSLLLCFPRRQLFVHYDSVSIWKEGKVPQTLNGHCAAAFSHGAARALGLTAAKFREKRSAGPNAQKNNYDCGVFAVETARLCVESARVGRLTGKEGPTQEEVSRLREELYETMNQVKREKSRANSVSDGHSSDSSA